MAKTSKAVFTYIRKNPDQDLHIVATKFGLSFATVKNYAYAVKKGFTSIAEFRNSFASAKLKGGKLRRKSRAVTEAPAAKVAVPDMVYEVESPPHKFNPVSFPEHYINGSGLQTIELIETTLTPDEFRGYLKGSILKYTLRAGRKGPAAEDYAKARWFIDYLALGE